MKRITESFIRIQVCMFCVMMVMTFKDIIISSVIKDCVGAENVYEVLDYFSTDSSKNLILNKVVSVKVAPYNMSLELVADNTKGYIRIDQEDIVIGYLPYSSLGFVDELYISDDLNYRYEINGTEFETDGLLATVTQDGVIVEDTKVCESDNLFLGRVQNGLYEFSVPSVISYENELILFPIRDYMEDTMLYNEGFGVLYGCTTTSLTAGDFLRDADEAIRNYAIIGLMLVIITYGAIKYETNKRWCRLMWLFYFGSVFLQIIYYM